MARAIAGVIGGVVAWFLIATLGNLALRFAWTSYAEVEPAMTFTLAMLTARLLVGALSSLGAGAALAWIMNRHIRLAGVLAGVLVVLFIPEHYTMWNGFPLWYHLVFFGSLIVMTLLGAWLYRRAASGESVHGDPAQPRRSPDEDGR